MCFVTWMILTGETLLEVQQRLLKERELKIRSALEKLRRKRRLLRSQRKNKEFPVISVLGYTNCGEHGGLMASFQETTGWILFLCAGKTTLIKSLTGDSGLQPKNQLFATLDVTVHAGQLPNHMTVLYVDTIGFLSQLPHQLIDSFSATLEDIKYSVCTYFQNLWFCAASWQSARFSGLSGFTDSCQRHQSSRDGESEGKRTEYSQEYANPWGADGLDDRSPQ